MGEVIQISTINHFTNTSIQLISDVLQEMIPYLNGIDYFAEYMVDVVVLITSTKQILKKVYLKTKVVQRKD
jgi:GTP1/Obg family GTP-binding protein